MGRSWQLGVLAALILGTVLRLACLSGEFWLDEIWSWELSRAAGPPWAVFTLWHDNNHHLNTLWLWLCPDCASWTLYRLPSVLAGLASIVLAVVVARRHGNADAVFAGFLTASCYWLVLYSTEARGYSLAVFFALLALWALERYLDNESRWSLALFWLASIAGFLSHLTFVHVYLGFVAWTFWRAAKEWRSAEKEFRRLVACHGVPGVFFLLFYQLSIRGMVLGGGPPASTAEVLTRLVSMGLGGPPAGLAALPWLIGAALLFTLGMWRLAKQPGEQWVFYAVAIVFSPALFLLYRKQFLFERYFIISFVFFLLLSCQVLGWLWRSVALQPRRLPRRLLAVLVLLAVVTGNLVHDREFALAGRGDFHMALDWVVEHDPGEVVVITGDHDLRVKKYVQFYSRYLRDPRKVVYLSLESSMSGGAGWLLMHRLDERDPPGEVVSDPAGNVYRLEQAYPSRGPGCWGWFVYRGRFHQ